MKPWENGTLQVSKNHRYLCNGDQPFFWLGDTAWLLFSRLTPEEAEIYLRNRKEKGYNVIQATLIHEWPQKNVDGAYALKDGDYAAPDTESGYWQRTEAIVDIAEKLGLYMALLPTWGCHVANGHLNMENVDKYLDFLLERFGNRPNVLWLVGGDVKGDAAPEVFNHIGRRLRTESRDQLVGFHPFGRTSSSLWFHEEEWLCFNMFQSGHRRYDQTVLGAWDDNGKNPDHFGEDNWKYVERDLGRTPAKPTVDGEPSYEQILQGLHDETQPYWQAWDTRRYAYWSVFAGAFGHTFGDNAIMQFFKKERDQKGSFGVWQDWDTALHNIGGMQMKHLKELMESVDYQNGRPAQELITGGQGEKYDRISAFAGEDFVFCYDYNHHPFTVDLRGYEGSFDAYWADPVSGGKSYFAEVKGGEEVTFTPMERLEGHSDWVLALYRRK
ncbi:MAG: glycoside hydrolase family 140 protein [Candidatus Limivivens sp.]|nr:glycoside hydrolase family 140 protein [Candidatus Limivivens sp.]